MSRQVTRSLTHAIARPSSLLRLPLELLREIVDTFDDYEQGNVLRTLMSTTRHLRGFALPLFFKAVHLNKPGLFRRMVTLLRDTPEVYEYIR